LLNAAGERLAFEERRPPAARHHTRPGAAVGAALGGAGGGDGPPGKGAPSLQLALIVLAFLTGMALALQPVLNANIVARVGHPILGALISVTITFTALLLATVLMRVPLPGPRSIAAIPPWLYVGGLIGALFLFASLYLAPRLGVAARVALLVAGQLAAALILDHFGWLGVPERPFNLYRLLGACCLLAGVLLIRRF
jgi:transporter family-2 protein